ncbi:MAG: NUDIX hydrolase [Parcubacteria group bacterium]
MNKKKPWSTLSSKIIHKNERFYVSHEKFALPGGKTGDYYFFNTVQGTNKSVLVIPIIKDEILLIKQYRYLTKNWSLEIPGGGVKKDSTFLKTAQKELCEEVGYKAKKFRLIGRFDPYTSKSKEICSVYLATDLSFVGQKLDDEEHGSEVVRIKIKKLYQLVDKGEITSGPILAALALANKKLLQDSILK